MGALGGKRTSALPYGFGVFPQPLSCQHRSTRPRATAFKMAFSFFFQVRAFLLQPPSPSLVLLLRLHIHAPAPAPVEHQSTAQGCCKPYLGAACVLCAVSCAFCALCYMLCAAIRCLVLCARWYVQQPPHGAAACSSAHLPIQSLTLAAVKCEILQVDIARTPANFLIASSS